MRIAILLLAVAILAAAAPPEKKKANAKGGSSPNDVSNVQKTSKPVPKPKPVDANAKGNSTDVKGNFTETNLKGNNSVNANGTDVDGFGEVDDSLGISDYCYKSTWAFKCRHINPTAYDLECRIADADGTPCFPDMAQMIEGAAPLSSIAYPIYSLETLEAAEHVEFIPTIVTADNIETIGLHAPIEYVPAGAFASMPHLKKIILDSLDGVKAVQFHKDAFKNTTAKHLHLAGYDIRHIMAQDVDFHYFDTITFSDMEVECYHNFPRNDNQPQFKNVSCDHLFDDLKSIENLNMESIYVYGDIMDHRVLRPMWDSLKKLTLDVVFKPKFDIQENKTQQFNVGNKTVNASGSNARVHYGYFPLETFAFMSKLEEIELYLYEPTLGFSIANDTPVPLPVSKTLTRLNLSCRYCKPIDVTQAGKMLPNLHHLTIAAPLQQTEITDTCLKPFTKLTELILYDGDLTSIKPGAFRNTDSLKHLSINYAFIKEIKAEHLDGLEDTLETLKLVGTHIENFNVSKFEHLTSLDVSQNQLTTIERGMLPEKAQLTELNLSYNPIKHVENGFLSGVHMKDGSIYLRGWHIESFDMNAVEGMEKLQVVDITKNPKLKQLHVTDYTKLPSDLRRIVVGRSPLLMLDNENGTISKMLQERNITLVIEGRMACCCDMQWMIEMEKENPHLLEFNSSRAVCSRDGSQVDGKFPEEFWKNPTVSNFLNMLNDEKLGICKKGAKTTPQPASPSTTGA